MITKFLESISDLLSKGHPRSVKAKKNIAFSFVIKGLDIFIGLAIVPISLHYLGVTKYGIWITISALVNWFGFLNIGLDHGLRNKFAEAIAQGNLIAAKKIVSTGYFIITVIMIFFFFIFLIINNYIEWHKILNTTIGLEHDLSLVGIIIFGSFSVRLITKLVSTIIIADQRPAIADFMLLIAKLFILILIVTLYFTTKESLIYLALVYSAIPVFTYILASIYFFLKDYSFCRPSFRYIDFSYITDLINLGLKFFTLQISFMVVFMTDNLIIAQLFNQDHVTSYYIANRFFSIILLGFTIIVNPMWSAYTEAYHKKDLNWIKSAIKKQKQIWYFIIFLIALMLLLANNIYKIWIGSTLKITFFLSLGWGIFILLRTKCMIFNNFLNGIGKINLQLYIAIFNILIHIPLAIFLAKFLNLGPAGVIFATNISLFIELILISKQYRKIVSGVAIGIWNR